MKDEILVCMAPINILYYSHIISKGYAVDSAGL